MDTIRDAIAIGTRLIAQNLPGGKEILKIFKSEDSLLLRNVVRQRLSETYYLYPDFFIRHGTLSKAADNLYFIEIPDKGRYGKLASNALSISEKPPIEPELAKYGNLSIIEFDSYGAIIPLDVDTIELKDGTSSVTEGDSVTFVVSPYTELDVSDASGLVINLAGIPKNKIFKPLLIYSLPIQSIDPPIISKYSPHIPLAVLGYLANN